jgi:alpha-tubulin suppressor-like RCC1 family protein
MSSAGQIGDGAVGENRNAPVHIGTFDNWATVSAANHQHSLALRANGELWSWGGNVNGELGLGTTTNRNVPTFVSDGWRVPSE